MSYAMQIRKTARELARDADHRAVNLKQELASIEARKIKVEAQLHAANLAHERFSRFQPEIDGSLQCPACWIEHDLRSALTEIPGTPTEDIFRCHECGFDLVIPLKGKRAPEGGGSVQ